MIKTGFSFIDDNIGGLKNHDVMAIYGECDKPTYFTISLMQSILEHNDGYILLFNANKFYPFITSIFAKHEPNDDYMLLAERMDKNRIMKKFNNDFSSYSTFLGIDFLKRNINCFLNIEGYERFKNKKLLAVFAAQPNIDTDSMKVLARSMNAPFVFWSYELLNIHLYSPVNLNVDVFLEFSAADGYKAPIMVEGYVKHKKKFSLTVNKDILKYSERLKDCKNLWFYEEQNGE